jgi:hypothetical protein
MNHQVKSIIVASLCTVIAMASCCKKTTTPQIISNKVYQAWHLYKLEPGFSPTSFYNRGDVVWQINSNTLVNVTVAISNVSASLPLNTTGSYAVALDTTLHTIVINNENFDYNILSDTLIINGDVSADGKRLIFVK